MEIYVSKVKHFKLLEVRNLKNVLSKISEINLKIFSEFSTFQAQMKRWSFHSKKIWFQFSGIFLHHFQTKQLVMNNAAHLAAQDRKWNEMLENGLVSSFSDPQRDSHVLKLKSEHRRVSSDMTLLKCHELFKIISILVKSVFCARRMVTMVIQFSVLIVLHSCLVLVTTAEDYKCLPLVLRKACCWINETYAARNVIIFVSILINFLAAMINIVRVIKKKKGISSVLAWDFPRLTMILFPPSTVCL